MRSAVQKILKSWAKTSTGFPETFWQRAEDTQLRRVARWLGYSIFYDCGKRFVIREKDVRDIREKYGSLSKQEAQDELKRKYL